MPIPFKSALSSSVANSTFLDKTIDDLKKGVLGLYKVSPSEPEAISDLQVFINEIADVDGIVGEGDPNSKTYSSEEIIANGDDRKAAIGKLDAQAKANLDKNDNQDIQITNNIRTTYANEAIAAAGTITKDDSVYTQVRRVSGDSAPQVAASEPFGDSSSTSDGLVIILRGTDAVNSLTIPNSDTQYGCILNGDAELLQYCEIELMYDSILERYIEQRRNF